MNRYFIKEALYMTDKHMKRCLIPLVIREMQIKTMMMHDCTLIGTESIKNKWQHKMLPRMRRNWINHKLVVVHKMVDVV